MRGGCGTCGWPRAGDTCEACGAPSAETAYAPDVDLLVVAGPQPEDYPSLKNAFIAWQQRDYARMVGQCLVALGVTTPQITSLPIGSGWSFFQDSALVCLAVDRSRGEIIIESPMVLVPSRQRVPLLRVLLELNARALGASRFCVRRDVVVLRYADRIENVSPPKLVAAIKEVALRADRYDDVLRLAFGAKMIGPEAKRSPNPWVFLGTPRKLEVLKGGDAVAPPSSSKDDEPRDAISRSLDAVDRVLDLARAGQMLAKPLFFARKPSALALLHRAVSFRAAYEARSACPDAVHLLFSQAELAYPGFFAGPPHAGVTEGSCLMFDATLGRIVQQRAQVGKQQAIEVPVMRTALEAKTLLRQALEEVDKAQPEPPLRHAVLLGLLCELALRIKMAPPMHERVTRAITEASASGATAPAIQKLSDLVRGMAQ